MILEPSQIENQAASAFLVNDWAPPAGQGYSQAASVPQAICQTLDSCDPCATPHDHDMMNT